MNYKYSYLQIFSFILSLILFTSGIAQDKTNIPTDSAVISNSTGKTTKLKGNQVKSPTLEISWVDPLFYIEGQLCQHVRQIFQDKNGNLWFGTNVYGLMLYSQDTLAYFSETDGLGMGRITGIVEDQTGNLWIGTYGGLSKYDPVASKRNNKVSFTNYSEKDGLLDNEIWSLTIDVYGTIWIGTNEGVSCFDGKKFSIFPLPKAKVQDTTTTYSYDRITCILEDRKGTLWFGTDGFGICKYGPTGTLDPDENTFTHVTMEDGLPSNNIGDILEDKNGNIWIGTSFGGISRFDGKTFTNFTKNGIIDGIETGGFYEAKNGTIWFAAENFGVYSFDGESFTNYNTKDGLNTNGILSIYEDKEERFWFGGWGGLFRYKPTSSLKSGRKSFFSVTRKGPWAK